MYDKIIVPGNNHDFTTHVISLPQLEFAEALQNHLSFYANCMNDLKQKIRTIPDLPAPGILFRDITTLLADPGAFNDVIENLLCIISRNRLNCPIFTLVNFERE